MSATARRLFLFDAYIPQDDCTTEEINRHASNHQNFNSRERKPARRHNNSAFPNPVIVVGIVVAMAEFLVVAFITLRSGSKIWE